MYFLDALGFSDIELKYLSPVPEHIKIPTDGDKKFERVNEVLFEDQEFAVIATKSTLEFPLPETPHFQS